MMPETTVSIALILSLVACGYQVYQIWNTHRKNEEEEQIKAIESEKNFLKLDIKLDNMNDNLHKLVNSDEFKTKQINEISESIVLIREQIKTVFNKVENHEQRIYQIEHNRNLSELK